MPRLADSTNEVTVVFKDAAVMFALPAGATLQDLAAQIARIEERRSGEPLAIGVKLHH
jgi:hypothetical protein